MIIGHETICKFLEGAISNSKIAHAYLFCGPEHVGKRRIAEWFVSKLLKIDEAKLKTYSDFYILERSLSEDKKFKNSIGVLEVRALRNQLQLSSLLNSWKIALIPDAELLTIEAANALLKTLEEPKNKVCLILLANHKASLPETIVSRCQLINFRQVPSENIYKALLALGANNEEALNLSRIAEGLPGIATNFFNNKEELERWAEDNQKFANLINTSIAERLFLSKKFVDARPLTQTLDGWLNFLRYQAFLYYNCKELVPADVQGMGGLDYAKLLDMSLSAKKLNELNVNKSLLLENILINL